MSHLTEDPAIGRRISTLVLVLLAVAGLLAAAGTLVSVSNYRRSVAALGSFRLQFTELTISEGDNPTAEVYMRLRNDSALPVWVGSYEFSLYLNGERIGGSSSSYRASDASPTDAERRQDKTVGQELGPGESVDLAYAFDVYHLQRDFVRRAQEEGATEWMVGASFQINLPTAHREEMVGLRATLENPSATLENPGAAPGEE